MIYTPCFQSMAIRNPIEMPVRARARACVQVNMVTRFPLVPVLVRLDDFARGVNLFSLSLSLSFFLFLFPQFSLCFFFFCDEENKRRERIRKKRVFSSFEFLQTFYEVYGCIRAVFSTSLARAVPSQRARVEGTGKWWRVKLSCKVGFLFRVSNSQLSFSCENAFWTTSFFFNKIKGE